MYDRDLAYLFEENGENINKKLIEAGYANAYFPEGKDNYYSSFMSAWKICTETGNKNLCRKSSDICANCIEIHKFGPDEDLILYNSCSFNCNLTGWSVKDEGRKKFVFEDFVLKSNNQVTLTAADFNQTYVWTNTGDTIFMRDKKGDLGPLRELIRNRVKQLILIGEAKERMGRELGGLTDTAMAKNLEEAVTLAYQSAKRGEVVLLSPACSSFDMFKDYKERGRVFKEAVQRL